MQLECNCRKLHTRICNWKNTGKLTQRIFYLQAILRRAPLTGLWEAKLLSPVRLWRTWSLASSSSMLWQSIIETDSTLRKHLVRICRAKVHGLCQSCGVAVRAHPHRWCGLVTYFMPMTMHGNVPSKNVQPDHHGYNATSLSEYCWWLKSCTACHVLHCSTFDASPCNPHNFNVGMTSRVVQDFSHSWLRLFPAFEYLQC